MSLQDLFSTKPMSALTDHVNEIFSRLTPQQRSRIRRGHYNKFFREVDKCYRPGMPGSEQKECILEGVHANCISEYDQLTSCLNQASQSSCKD